MSDLELVEAERPKGPTEYRAVAETIDVDRKQRIIELVAVPYDRPADVEYRGRMITEEIAPGAFDGVERRANRIKANLGHDRQQRIGTCIALHPKRAVGLVAEIQIGRNYPNVLIDAEDGLLDASIGFAPFPGYDIWTESRSKRRITKAWLDHIALVPDPAYEDATVLAVREAAVPVIPAEVSPTPNLDQVNLLRLIDKAGHSGRTGVS